MFLRDLCFVFAIPSFSLKASVLVWLCHRDWEWCKSTLFLQQEQFTKKENTIFLTVILILFMPMRKCRDIG